MCLKVPIVKAPDAGTFLNFGKRRKRSDADDEDDDFESSFQKFSDSFGEFNETSASTTATTARDRFYETPFRPKSLGITFVKCNR
jgi:hypothetical protein